eukprot:jgi/Galph1/2061/GphlegSOOS_G763.1
MELPEETSEGILKQTQSDEAVAVEANGSSNKTLLGASLLYSGTVIGAGMLALPLETLEAGFAPSVLALLICWLFTLVSSLLVLEAAFTATFIKSDVYVSFFSIASLSLGLVGKLLTCCLYLFILVALLVSYLAGGGNIMGSVLQSLFVEEIPLWIASALFISILGPAVFLGSKWCDYSNRFLMAVVSVGFLVLVISGLPNIKYSLLLHAQWSAIWPGAIAVGVIAFMAQNVVPVLVSYTRDIILIRKAIVIGSIIPLIMYLTWELVVLGMIPYDDSVSKSTSFVTNALSSASGHPKVVSFIASLFSLFALASSFLGVSLSSVELYCEFFDSLRTRLPLPTNRPMIRRLLAFVFTMVPPYIFAVFLKDAFVVAMETSGVLGGLSIYGIIPAVVVFVERTRGRFPKMDGRLPGGKMALILFVIVCFIIIILDLYRIFTSSFVKA